MTADLHRRARTPQEERRLQALTDQLIATGTLATDITPAGSAQPPADGPQAAAATAAQSSALISRVHPHPGNIRSETGDIAETAASITAHGILQPLTVEPVPGRPGHWRVIAGHRRLAAAKMSACRRPAAANMLAHGRLFTKMSACRPSGTAGMPRVTRPRPAGPRRRGFPAPGAAGHRRGHEQ